MYGKVLFFVWYKCSLLSYSKLFEYKTMLVTRLVRSYLFRYIPLPFVSLYFFIFYLYTDGFWILLLLSM